MLATAIIVFREVLEASLVVGIVLAASRGVPRRGVWVTSGITAGVLGAAIVVLMLSGGEALEDYATARASSVLDALARRVPSVAHRKEPHGLVDVKFADIRIGDELTVRAEVTGNYERKGHRFVDLDALVIANSRTPVARIAHTAIYRPRQVDAAA